MQVAQFLQWCKDKKNRLKSGWFEPIGGVYNRCRTFIYGI